MKKPGPIPILLIEFLVLLLTMVILSAEGFSQVKHVWALGDGEKVFRDDLEHPGKHGNFTWDGKLVRIKGLYNETLAFQVVVESGKDSARAIELSIELPANKKAGATIGANTLKYGPAGTVELFSEHYLYVKDSTHPNWFYGSPAAQPKKMTGWIPDALIPTDAKQGQGGFPVDMGPNRNQGFWVDIQLPRDQQAISPGIYTGNVSVTQAGKPVAQIPFEIELLPPYLTDENKTNVWLFTGDVYPYYPDLAHEQVDKMLKFEGHRHRIDVAGGFRVNTRPFNHAELEKYKPFLNGDAFTPAMGYHGTGQGIGEKIFPVGMYASPVLGNTKEAIQEQADRWVSWFKSNAPGVTYFWYIIDEPLKDKYEWIRERSGWVKSNPGPGKLLPVFTTTNYQEELKGAIDIWAGYDGLDLGMLPGIREQGGDHWFYNGNRPRYGSVILEAAAVDPRVNSWVLYKYGIKTWFLWQGTHWHHNGQGPKAHLHQNIFENPLTFINQHMEYGNGDGIVFYPGHMPFYPEEDRGLNRLLPSIRLKNIRRGQQDAAIMWMAEQKAGRDKVMSIIGNIVPRALSEVSMKEAVPWSEKGDEFDKARIELLKLL